MFLTWVHATVHTGGIQPEKMKEGNQDWCQGEVPKVSFLLWGDSRFLRVVHLVSPGDATPQSAAQYSWLDGSMRTFRQSSVRRFAGSSDRQPWMLASPCLGVTAHRGRYAGVHRCLIQVPQPAAVECANRASSIWFSLLNARSNRLF